MRIGTRVSGKYLGEFPFRGVVRELRNINAPKAAGAVQFTVTLDEPIVVFGREASLLLLIANWDGAALSTGSGDFVVEEID